MVFAQSLFDTKTWYFHQTFQPNHSLQQLKDLGKVPLFCVKQRSCKHCSKNEFSGYLFYSFEDLKKTKYLMKLLRYKNLKAN